MTKTRLSIIRRMTGNVPARSVPKFVQDVIDIVVDLFKDEVFEKYPRSNDAAVEETRYWERLDFYKKKVMAAFLREYHTDELDRLLRGRAITSGTAAIFFHQYVAAIKRACDTDTTVDIEDCPLSIDVGDVQQNVYRHRGNVYVI